MDQRERIERDLLDDLVRITQEQGRFLELSYRWARYAVWPLTCAGTFELVLGVGFATRRDWIAVPFLVLAVWCLGFAVILWKRFP